MRNPSVYAFSVFPSSSVVFESRSQRLDACTLALLSPPLKLLKGVTTSRHWRHIFNNLPSLIGIYFRRGPEFCRSLSLWHDISCQPIIALRKNLNPERSN